jgi:hypothetical protein
MLDVMSQDVETPQKTKRPFDWDRLIGLSALMASVATVAFLAYQAYLMRVQVEASTWPYLQIVEGCCGEGLKVSVQNKGVGPAMVRLAVVKVDGKPKKTWAEVLAALVPDPPPAVNTASLSRRVLDSGVTVVLLQIDDVAYSSRVHAEFLRGRVLATACYCSVLDKCWIAAPTLESLPVPACPEVPVASRFAQ